MSLVRGSESQLVGQIGWLVVAVPLPDDAGPHGGSQAY